MACPFPPGGSAFITAHEAREIAETLKGPWSLKAQIHAGGRGKGGGVKLANSLDEVSHVIVQPLGDDACHPSTGPEGRYVQKILCGRRCAIAHEYYLSLCL